MTGIRQPSKGLARLAACAVLLTQACASSSPRVLEVSRTFPKGKSVQAERIFARWSSPTPIEQVTLEYRQANRPAAVMEVSVTPEQRNWAIFEIPATQLRADGPVSAWRVSIWDHEQRLAEKHSAVW